MAHVAGGLGCFLQRGIVEDVEHLTVTMGDVLGQLVCLATKSIVQGVALLKTQLLDNYWKKRAFLLSQLCFMFDFTLGDYSSRIQFYSSDTRILVAM